ncbi:MAG: hypothetical protein GY737_04835, partial [Desulfobacteraceae bacterium]|nr:hypothetical protein [Desulfobacteraceae bacterium]
MYSYSLPVHDPELLDILWEASADSEKEEELRELILSSVLSKPYGGRIEITDDMKKTAHKAIDAMPVAAKQKMLEDTYIYGSD